MDNNGARRRATGAGHIKIGAWLKAAGALSMLAALLFTAETALAETVDKIAAVVNGDIITSSDVNHAMALYQHSSKSEKNQENMRREILDRLIDDLILKSAVEKAKVTVDDEDLARAVSNVLRQNRMTPEQLKSDLAAKGISYDAYKQRLAQQIMLVKFTNQVVGQQVKLTDRDVRDYFERNRDRFGGEGASFESVKEKAYDMLYEERMDEALHNYLLAQRQKAYIDIR